MTNFKGSSSFFNKFNQRFIAQKKNVNPSVLFVLVAGDFNKFIELSSFQELLDISRKYGQNNCFCESRQNSSYVNLFFDYDCKDNLKTQLQAQDVINELKQKIQTILPQLNIQFFVKQATNEQDLISSMHFIIHLSTSDGHSIYFDYSKGCAYIKHFVSKLDLQKPYDMIQVYSGHLLRLLYSNKFNRNNGELANRIFQLSPLSDFSDELSSLSTYCNNSKFMLLSDYLNKHFVLQYVKSQGYVKNYLFSQILYRYNEQHLSLSLTEQKTPLCSHKSNNAVAMFYHQSNNPNIIIKCQDQECNKFIQAFVQFDNSQFPSQITISANNSSKSVQSNNNKQQQQQSQFDSVSDKNMVQEISFMINKVLLDEFGLQLDQLTSLGNNYFMAIGKSPKNASSQESKEFTGQEKQIFFRQQSNGHIETINQPKELQKILAQITQNFNSLQIQQFNVQYNNFDNSIHYHYHATPSSSKNQQDDFNCDDLINLIQFDNDLEKKFVNKLFNKRMQYITQLYQTIQPNQFIYKSSDDSKKSIYYFTNINNNQSTDGGHWSNEDGTKELVKRIRNTFEDYFDTKKKLIDKKFHKKFSFIFNQIMNVIDKQGQIQQYAMETFKDSDIEFDQNIHLLHFFNGTFDLESRSFIKTTPDMYNTQQIRYNYNKYAKYDFIEPIVKQIIGDHEYQWFIQQLAYCLMPDRILEKKQIVILTGQGNNGKTLIFNLMNNTMDTMAYGVNGRSIMIQASNEQMSAATPDLMTLKDMRFCYFAELDANKPFNQQQIKLLTGGEKIKGRNLYGNLQEFEAHAGLFVSCNILPKINTADGGFVDRLKVIQLNKQFVDKPNKDNQFHLKKDPILLNKIKTVKWRQGFFNMLLNYYYKDNMIELPDSIYSFVQQKINLNKDPVHMWAEENIIYDEESYNSLEELTNQYNYDNSGKDISQKTFQEKFDQYLKQNPQQFNNVKYDRKNKPRNKEWKYQHLPKKMVFFNIKIVDTQTEKNL